MILQGAFTTPKLMYQLYHRNSGTRSKIERETNPYCCLVQHHILYPSTLLLQEGLTRQEPDRDHHNPLLVPDVKYDKDRAARLWPHQLTWEEIDAAKERTTVPLGQAVGYRSKAPGHTESL